MNLRDLTDDQQAILAQVESGDFTLNEVSDHLELLGGERNQKIESYLHVINRLDNQVSAVDAEISRLSDIKKSKSKALDNIKSWLLMCMKDGEKHEFDLFKVTRVKGRETATVIDDKKLPMKFMSHKPESWSPDKRAILAELKNGTEIEGAEISIGNPSLRIK